MKSNILLYIVNYSIKELYNNRLLVRSFSEIADKKRLDELKKDNKIDDLEIFEIKQGDYEMVWLEKEEARKEIENILDDMDRNENGKYDSEKEVKRRLLEEASSDVEKLAIRFYYELFRTIDAVYLIFENTYNCEDAIMSSVSEMLYISREKTEMLYLAYKDVASRLYRKEMENSLS